MSSRLVPLTVVGPRGSFALLSDLNGQVHFVGRIVRRLGVAGMAPVRDHIRRFRPRRGFSTILDHTFTSVASVIG